MFKTSSRLFNILLTNVRIQRYKHKANHWSVQRKNKTGTIRALEHFDEFYTTIYKQNWSAIRQSILGKQKYVAVLNNYSDIESASKFLQNKGAINIRTLFHLEKDNLQEEHVRNKRKHDLERVWKSVEPDANRKDEMETKENKEMNFSLSHSLENAKLDFSRLIDGQLSTGILYDFIPATKLQGRDDFIPEVETGDFNPRNHLKGELISVQEDKIDFPEHLDVFCFEDGNINEFPQPRRGSTQVLNYYLMDGASVLPVLALDLQPGSRMLDMCAAPGGKSVIALQTLYPHSIRCNDISLSRTNRIHSVMNQYLYDFEEKWLATEKITISQGDARHIQAESNTGGFDRVLVDVPCTTDRHSVKEDDNNIFRPDRVKERLQLPELQTELLMNALKVVKVGGNVVYSTCSLSPIQNEGVVHMAIKKLWEESDIRVTIKDLRRSLAQFRHVYHFSSPKITKYGHLVVPSVGQNYGPMYFCKLLRIK